MEPQNVESFERHHNELIRKRKAGGGIEQSVLSTKDAIISVLCFVFFFYIYTHLTGLFYSRNSTMAKSRKLGICVNVKGKPRWSHRKP